MAQDELTRLQNSLANYQTKNTSGQYNSTVANIENKINNLKGQAEFGSKPSAAVTSTSGATTPAVKTTTNQYDFTKTPAQNSGAGLNVSKSPTGGTVVGGTNTPKIVNSGVVPGTGVAGTTGVAVPAGAVNPPAVTPAPPATYALRDIATNAGMTVGSNGNIPLINGNQIDPAKAGLTLVDGRWQGTDSQVGGALGVPVELRGALEGTGRTVAWDPQTGRVTVNGIPVDTGSMVNIGGRYYTTQEGVDSIIARTGGNVPIGQDMRQVDNTATGEQGLGQTEDVTLKGQLDDSLLKIKDLEAQISEIGKLKVPEIDYTPITKILEQMKNYTNVYDKQLGELVKSTLASTFEYSPDNDPALQKAIKYADRTMMEQMNARGILSSSITEDNLRTIREDLLPEYQALALEKYNQELSQNFQKIGVLQSLSQNDYDRYKTFATLAIDNVDRITKNTMDTFKTNLELMQNTLSNKISLGQLEARNKAETYKQAWDKFRELGYVDEETSLLTGLPVGMRSREAENQILQRYDAYNKLAIERENQKIDTDYQFNLDIKKLKETAKINKEAAKEKEAMQAAAGKVYASIANMSAEQALNEVSKNFAALSEYMGPELWTLVDKLQSQKVVEDKAKADREQNSIQNSFERERINISRTNAEDKQAKDSSTYTTAEKNAIRSGLYKEFKGYSYVDAKDALDTKREDIELILGTNGWISLYNDVLADAIKEKIYPKYQIGKEPNNSNKPDWEVQLDEQLNERMKGIDLSK